MKEIIYPRSIIEVTGLAKDAGRVVLSKIDDLANWVDTKAANAINRPEDE